MSIESFGFETEKVEKKDQGFEIFKKALDVVTSVSEVISGKTKNFFEKFQRKENQFPNCSTKGALVAISLCAILFAGMAMHSGEVYADSGKGTTISQKVYQMGQGAKSQWERDQDPENKTKEKFKKKRFANDAWDKARYIIEDVANQKISEKKKDMAVAASLREVVGKYRNLDGEFVTNDMIRNFYNDTMKSAKSEYIKKIYGKKGGSGKTNYDDSSVSSINNLSITVHRVIKHLKKRPTFKKYQESKT